jgi:NAD kinase
MISADGQEEALVKPPVELLVRKAAYKVKLVKRPNRSYFEVLRAKLLWGKDPRFMQ